MAQGFVNGQRDRMSEENRARVMDTLRESLRALASSSEPGMAVTALDLASNFECARRAAVDIMVVPLSDLQVRALCSMQEYIDFMHTLAPRVWSESAVNDHACWQQLKELAEQTLAIFGWSTQQSMQDRE